MWIHLYLCCKPESVNETCWKIKKTKTYSSKKKYTESINAEYITMKLFSNFYLLLWLSFILKLKTFLKYNWLIDWLIEMLFQNKIKKRLEKHEWLVNISSTGRITVIVKLCIFYILQHKNNNNKILKWIGFQQIIPREFFIRYAIKWSWINEIHMKFYFSFVELVIIIGYFLHCK